jgi:hypothetical protein
MNKMIRTLFFLVGLQCTLLQADEQNKKNLQDQIAQLKIMLIESNDAYINTTIPMYQQDLDTHWTIELCHLMGFMHRGQHFYNAEIILTESKRLAELIVALEKIQEKE